MGPIAGLAEVASGEGRVASENSRAFGRAGFEVGVNRSADSSGTQKARAVWVWGRAGSGSRGCG